MMIQPSFVESILRNWILMKIISLELYVIRYCLMLMKQAPKLAKMKQSGLNQSYEINVLSEKQARY